MKSHGIDLLIVLVPDKTAIYPDMISDTIPLRKNVAPPRLDQSDEQFEQILEKNGVNVVDLTNRFLTDPNRPQLYYKQDTHWTPYAVSIAADAVARYARSMPWYAAIPKHRYIESNVPCSYPGGDLYGMLQPKDLQFEKEGCTSTQEQIESGFWLWRHTTTIPFQNSNDTPVVLIGDSYADRLNEPLATALGFPTATYTVSGSGGEHARMMLRHQGTDLGLKKLVVWCFSARELTEERGWRSFSVFKEPTNSDR